MTIGILTQYPDESRPFYKGRLRCRLYCHPIVDELPRHCPFRAARPTKALWAMKDLAWSGIGCSDNDGQLADGIHLQKGCEVCYGCIAANLGHPTIERIRGALGVGR